MCVCVCVGEVQHCSTGHLTLSNGVLSCSSLNYETNVSYSCSTIGGSLTWDSSVFATGRIRVTYYRSDILNANLTIDGIKMAEKHTDDPVCINSTITFFGLNLHALNGVSVNCSSARHSHQVIISGECIQYLLIINFTSTRFCIMLYRYSTHPRIS